MRKLAKSYTQFDLDGISAERKFAQLDQNSIEMSLSWHSKIVPFAMDHERREFIIFMIERFMDLNLYIWVYYHGKVDGKTVRITTFDALRQFTKWSGEPMDVSGAFDNEVVADAIHCLQNVPSDDILSELAELYDRMNKWRNDASLKEDEKIMLHDVQEARKENNGMMFMC